MNQGISDLADFTVFRLNMSNLWDRYLKNEPKKFPENRHIILAYPLPH
jgi:hypothetical protein